MASEELDLSNELLRLDPRWLDADVCEGPSSLMMIPTADPFRSVVFTLGFSSSMVVSAPYPFRPIGSTPDTSSLFFHLLFSTFKKKISPKKFHVKFCQD